MSVRYSIKNSTGTVISVIDTAHPGSVKHRYLPTGASTLIVPDEEVPVIAVQLAALATQFGALFVVTTQNPSTGQLVALGAPAAKGTTNVHAGVASSAANIFPGPFTNPDVPRNLRLVFAAAYDGGNVTVVGTDQYSNAQSELIVAVAATTVVGVKIFKTVTAATKATVGATANTVSVGTGDKLGVSADLTAAQLFVDGISEAATLDTTNKAITPTTVPNGAKVFQVLSNTLAA